MSKRPVPYLPKLLPQFHAPVLKLIAQYAETTTYWEMFRWAVRQVVILYRIQVWWATVGHPTWAADIGQVDDHWMTVWRKRGSRSRELFKHVHLWKGRLIYYRRFYREIQNSDRVVIRDMTDDRKRPRTNSM